MDYLEYYDLKEHPFSNVVDSRFYYSSRQHSNALVKLKYAVDTRKGLAVVIGGIGTGKTTLARRFLEDLDENLYEAALLVVVHSTVSSEWLFRKFAIQVERLPDILIIGQVHHNAVPACFHPQMRGLVDQILVHRSSPEVLTQLMMHLVE